VLRSGDGSSVAVSTEEFKMSKRLAVFFFSFMLALPAVAVADEASRPLAKISKSGAKKIVEKNAVSTQPQDEEQQDPQSIEAPNDTVPKKKPSYSRCLNPWLTLECHPSTVSIRGTGMNLNSVPDTGQRGKVHFWGLAYEYVFETPSEWFRHRSAIETPMLSIRGGFMRGPVDVFPIELTYYLSPSFITVGFNLGAWIIPSGPKLNGGPTSVPTWSTNSIVNPVFGVVVDFRLPYFDVRVNPLGVYSNQRLSVWIDVGVGVAF